MSKYVKDLVARELRNRLQGVDDALVVSVAGLDANKNNRLRMALREKNIHLLVIKNSLARRAAEGTPLAAAFERMEGSLAVVWGEEDIVSLAKQITRLAQDKQYAPFEARGGVMDGVRLTGEQVHKVSQWPSRLEQLSILAGQMLAPASNLASQLTSAAGALASQIQQRPEQGEPGAAGEPAPAGAA